MVRDEFALDDPEFARVHALVKNEDALMRKYRENLVLANSLDLRYYVVEHRSTPGHDWFRLRYPLVNIGYGGINAKYKVLAEKEKK